MMKRIPTQDFFMDIIEKAGPIDPWLMIFLIVELVIQHATMLFSWASL